MTRVSPRMIRQARRISPLLPRMLRAVPDLAAANQELLWIQRELPPAQWALAAMRRSMHEPLQYILGSQPFGELSISCVRGVLIPRWETEEWCRHLVTAVLGTPHSLFTIVDACTGTGCIPLYLTQKLSSQSIQVSAIGFDVSSTAHKCSLANAALYRNSFKTNIFPRFIQLDLFDANLEKRLACSNVDIVTANPPYVTESDYTAPLAKNGVQQSVRKFEPKLALIGNLEFYTTLVNRMIKSMNPKAFVFEVGYMHQATHVQELLDTKVWTTRKFNDSAGNIRCVYGWRRDDDLSLQGFGHVEKH